MMGKVEKLARQTVKRRLAKGNTDLEHLANLLLQGSFSKKHGILAPVNTTGLLGAARRLREDTFDPRIGERREIPLDLSGSGDYDISMNTGQLVRNFDEQGDLDV